MAEVRCAAANIEIENQHTFIIVFTSSTGCVVDSTRIGKCVWCQVTLGQEDNRVLLGAVFGLHRNGHIFPCLLAGKNSLNGIRVLP